MELNKIDQLLAMYKQLRALRRWHRALDHKTDGTLLWLDEHDLNPDDPNCTHPICVSFRDDMDLFTDLGELIDLVSHQVRTFAHELVLGVSP